jgi:hypothetical protein
MPCDPRKGYAKVDPGKVGTYRGLSIFLTYYDNNIRQEQYYWYALYPENDPSRAKEVCLFDIRDLPNGNGLSRMNKDHHLYLLKDAIDAKVLPCKDWLERVGWKFRLKDTQK